MNSSRPIFHAFYDSLSPWDHRLLVTLIVGTTCYVLNCYRWIRLNPWGFEPSNFSQGIRKLCGIERHYVRFSRFYSGSMKVGVLISFDERINVALLKTALKKMEKRHPALRSIIVDNETLIEQNQDDLVTKVFEYSRKGPDHWSDVWSHVQTQSLKLGTGLFQVHVINGDSESEILVSGEHFVCDAISLMELTHEMLKAIEDPPLQWANNITECLFESMPSVSERIVACVRYLTYALELNFCTKNGPRSREAEKDYGKPCVIASSKISTEDMAVLASACKKEYSVTLNALLSLVTFRALSEYVTPDKPNHVYISSAVDGRKRYQMSRLVKSSDLSYHSTAITYSRFIGGDLIKSAEHLWEELDDIGKKINEELADYWNTHSPMLTAPLVWHALPMEVAPTGILSNWGRSPFYPSYKNVGNVSKLRGLINFNTYNCPYIVFCSTKGELDITVIGSQRYLDQNDVENISETTKRILMQMCEYKKKDL